MASEVISHAIFAFSHPTPPPHRIVFHSASHPALRSTSHPASRPALHSTSHPALPPCTPTLHSHPALHSSPYSAQPCTHPAPHCLPLRLPPRAPLHISPCTPTLHPIMRFTQHLDPPFPSLSLSQVSSSSHRQATPSTSLHLSPVRQFPIRVSPSSVFLSQAPSPRTSPRTSPRIPSCPSPCAPTPFHTTHFPSASLHPPCPSAKFRLWIFSCVKRPGSLTT